MKFVSEFDKASGICMIRVTGPYRRSADSDRHKQFVLDFYAEHRCVLYLFDLSQAEISSNGTMTTFRAAAPKDKYAHTLRKVKTAIVYSKLTADDRFFETVSMNRGFQLRAFEAIDDALNWLKQGR